MIWLFKNVQIEKAINSNKTFKIIFTEGLFIEKSLDRVARDGKKVQKNSNDVQEILSGLHSHLKIQIDIQL